MRNRAKNVSRAALVAAGLAAVGVGLSTGTALADTATAARPLHVQDVATGTPLDGPQPRASEADKMPPVAKAVRKLIRSAGIPVPGPDSGPNDPKVPPKLPIEGLPLKLGGKSVPFLQ